ncbi:MAG: exodeoxyribonuclease V subunit gamma [Candidatus Binatia bacterium]
MLIVHRSNRAERLVEALAELVSEPLADVFLCETIVVQGKGMERWLSMELARRLGVWANPAFPFPRTLLNDVSRRLLGEEVLAAAAAFEPEALLWRVARLLPVLIEEPAFATIRSYLDGDERGVRRMQLALRIAAVFDRYVLYRPDLIRSWERGGRDGDEAWQPILWRECVRAAPGAHLAARVDALIERLSRPGGRVPGLPARLSIFGVTTLAPLYLRAFAALAGRLDVHLFLLTPSREFMGGTVARKRAVLAHASGQLELDLVSSANVDHGHPLVASLGKLGREFQDLLEEVDYDEPDELFLDPAPPGAPATMLEALQSDVLNLVDPLAVAHTPRLLLTEGAGLADSSIRIHSCHSPMREVEVMHDQLLALFDADRTLEPRHVVVLAPSIDEYAPYVDAVFSADRSRPSIPYHVADRASRASERVIDAFFRILEALRGRLSAPEVFDLLAMEPVRARFDIQAHELDTLRSWIDRAGIRWGVDEMHREGEGQLAIRENTWRFGLDRLLLGFAMPGRGRELFGGVLPVDGIEGTQGESLGKLAEFCETLFSFRRLYQRPLPVTELARELGELLERLLEASGDVVDQHRRIRRGIAALSARAEASGFLEPIHVETLVPELAREIDETSAPSGFLSAGVTFCAIVPMRSIPFRVLCLLGMNDGAFPRIARPPGFDLTAREPRRGDRSRRDDDRYAFLETLLSARERLLVSYVGRSVRDNSVIPPSVVVNDVIDALSESFVLDSNPAADAVTRRAELVRRLVVQHPLQPFSPAPFRKDREDRRLFSYSTAAFEGACAERNAATTPPSFVEGPISDDRVEAVAVSLDDLERFLVHPSRWFCQHRLGLFLGLEAGLLADREPLEIDALERWGLGDHLLSELVAGASLEQGRAALRARGLLPPGALGQAVYAEVAPAARRIADRVRQLTAEPRLEPIPVDLDVGGLRLYGVLRDVWACGQVSWRFSRLGRKHELALWLRHLVLQLVAPPGVARRTILLGQPANEHEEVEARFVPVANAAGELERLVLLHRQAAERPSPFFPETSRAFMRDLREARRRGEADAERRCLEKARAAFAADAEHGGEAGDHYVKKLFGEHYRPDRDPGFRLLAEEVLSALLEHREPSE